MRKPVPKKTTAARKPRAAPEKAPRRRLSPIERRLQIIEAARALFAEGGPDLLSMRNIARRVGITQAAIYQHFEDKEALVFAIVEDFFSELIEAGMKAAAEETDPLAGLARAMRGYVEVGLSRPDEYRLVFMTSIPSFRRKNMHRVPAGAPSPIQRSKGQIAFDYLLDRVRELIASGLIRKGEPEVVAEAIWAAGHGIVSLLITHVEFPWSREALVDTQIRIVLEGLLPDDSPARGARHACGAPRA